MNRRTLLKAVTAGAGSMIPLRQARAGTKVELLAEGTVPSNPLFVLAPEPVQLPPELLAGLQAGAVQIRARSEFPISQHHKLMSLHVFVVPAGTPMVTPVPPGVDDPATVTYAEIAVRDVIIERLPGTTPDTRICIAGTVMSNENVSPFGDLTGMPTVMTAGFSGEGFVQFRMYGAATAGSHATYCPVAYGYVRL